MPLDPDEYRLLADERMPALRTLLHAARDGVSDETARKYYAALADRIEKAPIREFLAFAQEVTDDEDVPILNRNLFYTIGTTCSLLNHYSRSAQESIQQHLIEVTRRVQHIVCRTRPHDDDP